MSRKQPQEDFQIPEQLNMDGLEERGNYRFIGCRRDFLHMLNRNHVAAYVTTALFRWTQLKRDPLLRDTKSRAENKLPPLKPHELEIWIHMSYEGFADEFDGLFSHNTIKDAVEYLLSIEVIYQRKNTIPRYKDYEYRLNLPLIRQMLKDLPYQPASRPRDNRNRKRVTKNGGSNFESPNLATSPKMVHESPEMADGAPNLVDMSPELVNHYTKSSQGLTKSSQGEETSVSTEEQNPPPPSEMNQEKKLMEEYIKNISQLRKETFPYPVPDAATPKEGTPGYATCLEIAELVLSLEELRPVYDALYNEQDKNGEYWRQGNPDRMGPVAFSKQYHRVRVSLPAGLFTPTQTNQNTSTSPQDEAETPVVEPEQQFIDEQNAPRVMPRGLKEKIGRLAYVKDFDAREVLSTGNTYYDSALTWGVTGEQFEHIVLLLIEECQQQYLSDIREYGCEGFEQYFLSRLRYELMQVTPYKEETPERMQA